MLQPNYKSINNRSFSHVRDAKAAANRCALQFVDKHRAFTGWYGQRSLFSFIKNAYREVIEFLGLQSYLPTSTTLVAQNGDHIPFQRQVFYTHNLHRWNDPINGFTWEADIETDDVFYYQGDR